MEKSVICQKKNLCKLYPFKQYYYDYLIKLNNIIKILRIITRNLCVP